MRASPKILFALLVALVFTLATALAPKAQQRSERRGADSFLKLMMGDGRRLFAKHFFTKADVYFHSGYYPTIFDKVEPSDQKPSPHDHNKSADHHDADGKHDEHHDDDGHEEGMDFVKEPRDWIERFGRNFTIHEHTHLAEGKQREMLPWLKIAAEMDAQMIETYTTAAYWLRKQKTSSATRVNFFSKDYGTIRTTRKSFSSLVASTTTTWPMPTARATFSTSL